MMSKEGTLRGKEVGTVGQMEHLLKHYLACARLVQVAVDASEGLLFSNFTHLHMHYFMPFHLVIASIASCVVLGLRNLFTAIVKAYKPLRTLAMSKVLTAAATKKVLLAFSTPNYS